MQLTTECATDSHALGRLLTGGVYTMLGICLQLAPFVKPARAQDQVSSSTQSDASQAGGIQMLQSVVVTATRVKQPAQSVPLSMTAVGAAQLAREGITNVSQLGQLSPSLFVLDTVSAGSPRFTIRGLTGLDILPEGSPAVATYIDDVYQASQFGISQAIFDLQRVEILRGPQGTTFGENTTGGAVAYYSQRPTNTLGGYVTISTAGGDQHQRAAEGALNAPLIDDVLAMRLSGKIYDDGAWVYDTANHRKIGEGHGAAGRFQLRWTPSDTTVANLILFDSRWRGDEPIAWGQFLPAAVNTSQVGLSAYHLYDDFDNGGATLHLEQELGALTLTSITHFRKTRYDTAEDIDGTAQDVEMWQVDALTEQYGQELRLSSDPKLRLSGILGLYFEHDHINDTQNYAAVITSDYNDIQYYLTTTKTYAAYGNIKFRITPKLSVISGIRKTVQDKHQNVTALYFVSGAYPWTQSDIAFHGAPPITPDQTLVYEHTLNSDPWTWDETLDYQATNSLLYFIRAAKGVRSGGFNSTEAAYSLSGLPASIPPAFQPEQVLDYEAGIKSTWLGDRLRVNASGYHYNFTDQQVTEYIDVNPVTENAANSKISGGELEVDALPAEHWRLRGTASYTDARYVNYAIPAFYADYSGNALVQSPKWIFGSSVSYVTPITGRCDLRGTVDWTYRTRIFYDSANSATLTDGSLSTGSVQLGIEPSGDRGLSVTGFVNNVTNQVRLASGFNFGPGYYIKYFDPGRSYGVRASYHW
jgi:iron complex outermembrane receptor protein